MTKLRKAASGIFASVFLVAAACGGSADPGAQPSDATPSPVSETREFVDVYGDAIEVPAQPKRIVAIHDYNGGEQILSLGYDVVGFPTREGSFNEEIARVYDLTDVAEVGEVYEPSFEAIAALEPDLIVGEGFNGKGMDQFMNKKAHDRLAAIAPVVYIDTFRPVGEVMADFAELLGARAEGEFARQREQYESALDAVSAELGDTEGLTVSVVGMRADDVIQTYGRETLVPSAILTSLGIEQSRLVDKADDEGGYLSLSLERIPEVDADLILLDKGQGEFGGDYTGNRLWQNLDAVRAGQVYEWGESWYGTTYHRYQLVLDELGPELIAADPGVHPRGVAQGDP